MESKIRKLVMASLFTALCCVVTMVIKIPSPFKGYMNIGDCIVLLSGWQLSPVYGFLAAGIGSALADLFSGYVVYAPVTFIIKGLMALNAYYGLKILSNRLGKTSSRIISGAVSEIIMIVGYFLFDGVLYGFVPSLAGLPLSFVQGFTGLILGVFLANQRVISKEKC